jgi:flagellar hook-associated protein 1 FlgK
VQVNASAAESLLKQATDVQQSVSGVNLDEEAANLIKYQQAYQAAGKVMATASTLFDTLLSLGR